MSNDSGDPEHHTTARQKECALGENEACRNDEIAGDEKCNRRPQERKSRYGCPVAGNPRESGEPDEDRGARKHLGVSTGDDVNSSRRVVSRQVRWPEKETYPLQQNPQHG